MDHATPEALEKYLHDHPKADRKNHQVDKDSPDVHKPAKERTSQQVATKIHALHAGEVAMHPDTRRSLKELTEAIDKGEGTKKLLDDALEGVEGWELKKGQMPGQSETSRARDVKKLKVLVKFLKSEEVRKLLK
jgi:uncharacterized protein (DUF342 family)